MRLALCDVFVYGCGCGCSTHSRDGFLHDVEQFLWVGGDGFYGNILRSYGRSRILGKNNRGPTDNNTSLFYTPM